ncbi:MAG: PAS domain S-box protein [Deltaproteobacteria bacterium]|nr:PAS domain S-box protein [Deltaproteobacteria bacterium]
MNKKRRQNNFPDLEKPVKSSFQYLSISYECALAIGNSLNLSEMLHKVIHTMVHKTNAHRGIIWVKNGKQELQPVASAGINIEDMLAQGEIKDLQNVLNQIQKNRQFMLKYKNDKDFLRYCPVLTKKEESVLIVPVTNVAIADKPLSNLLAGLSKKLSVAIKACMAHENVIKEIQVREKAEKELTKKTEQLISSQKKLQKLYGESEQARKSLLSILEDVAQKEEALQESEEKYRTLYDSSSGAIMLLDEKGFFDCNEMTLRLFACASREEFCSRHPADFSPPTQPDGTDSMSYARNKIAVALKEGSKRFEHLHQRSDGTDFPAEVMLDALMLGGKKVLQARVYDITERKRFEKALNDRIEFETIVASISTSFINLAPNEINIGIDDALESIGKFADVDRSYLFQLFDDETKIDNTHEWCAEGIVPQIENLKELSVADFPWFQERLNRFETVHVPRVADLPPEARAEKEKLQSQDILSVILVPMVYGKTLRGFIGFDSVRQEKSWLEENITLLRIVCEIFVNGLERKRVMDAIKDSEEKYRLLADNMADCLWQMNLNFEFTYANSSVLQMFGFTRDEWIGSSLSEHCSPEDMEFVSALVMELLKKGLDPGIKIFEMQLLHKNGKLVTAEINGKILFDENENPVGFQGSTRDITERKAAEEEIKKKTDELEKFNRLAVGRELKMIKLKKEINALLEKSGKEPGYKIVGEPQAEVF